MKTLFALLVLVPALGLSQKIKVNEYDRFTKQRRIESEPVQIMASNEASVYLSYNALGSLLHVQVSGFGWGASAVDEGQELVFLFSNDSVVKATSTALQAYDLTTSSSQNTYKHTYFIKGADIKPMSEYELVGIRKYGMGNFNDLKVSRENAGKVKSLSALFLEELKIGKVLNPLLDINVSDVSKHVGDSVRFCSKVYSARYFETSPNRPTILDVNTSFSGTLLNVVIWEQDRKNFGNAPESLYVNKEICVKGIVELNNNIPQIIIRSKEQITLKNPVALSEPVNPVRDTATAQVNEVILETAGTSPNSSSAGTTTGTSEKAASFPGGQDSFLKFLKNNLVCPPNELPMGEKKQVTAKFLITADGTATNVQIVKPAGNYFDNEVIRVLGQMPKWEPAIKNGVAVPVSVTQRVTFVRPETAYQRSR